MEGNFIMNLEGYTNCSRIDVVHLEEGQKTIKIVFSSGHVERINCKDREAAEYHLHSFQRAICEKTFNAVQKKKEEARIL